MRLKLKKPIRVWHELRRMRFSLKEAERIAQHFKRLAEDERDFSAAYIATAVCAKENLSLEIWHEKFVEAFVESRGLVRA